MHVLEALKQDQSLFAGVALPQFNGEVMTVQVQRFESDDHMHGCPTLRFTFNTDKFECPVVHFMLLDLYHGEASLSTDISVFCDSPITLSEQLRVLGECANLMKSVLVGKVQVDL